SAGDADRARRNSTKSSTSACFSRESASVPSRTRSAIDLTARPSSSKGRASLYRLQAAAGMGARAVGAVGATLAGKHHPGVVAQRIPKNPQRYVVLKMNGLSFLNSSFALSFQLPPRPCRTVLVLSDAVVVHS